MSMGLRILRGMVVRGRRSSPNAWFRAEENIPVLRGEWSDGVADLADRATFLLALDQLAERAGFEGNGFTWMYHEFKGLDYWEVADEFSQFGYVLDAGLNEPIKALRLALEQTNEEAEK